MLIDLEYLSILLFPLPVKGLLLSLYDHFLGRS